MPSANEAARWMFDEVRSMGKLDQEEACDYIHENFGDEFADYDEYECCSISKAVLDEFKKLHRGALEYDLAMHEWRMKARSDTPRDSVD